jgi:hypothetical protein
LFERFGRALGVAVVFDDEQIRQFPEGCDVEGFIEGAFRKRAVARKLDDDGARLRGLLSHGHADGDRRHAAEDAV